MKILSVIIPCVLVLVTSLLPNRARYYEKSLQANIDSMNCALNAGFESLDSVRLENDHFLGSLKGKAQVTEALIGFNQKRIEHIFYNTKKIHTNEQISDR